MNLTQSISDRIQSMRATKTGARLYHICDMVSLYSSLAIPFTFAGIVIGWWMQNPGITSLDSDKVYSINYQQTLFIEQPAMLDTKVGEVIYYVQIYNSQNEVVFKYPEMIVNSITNPKLQLEFPARLLQPGSYSIKGEANYALNPLKTAQIPINFGRVVIEGVNHDF